MKTHIIACKNHSLTRPESWTSPDPMLENLFGSPPPKKSNRWFIAWADIMMTMFIFFVVLYLYHAGDRKFRFDSKHFDPGIAAYTVSGLNPGAPVPIKTKKETTYRLRSSKQTVLETFITGSDVELAKDESIRLVLASDLFFDPGKADLKTEARKQLDQLGVFLRDTSHIINVVGHTDNLPSRSIQFPTNWELSTARASRVARYLIQQLKLPEDRFFVSGHASLYPLVPNTTAKNRSINRRVEIILLKEMPYPGPVSNNPTVLN